MRLSIFKIVFHLILFLLFYPFSFAYPMQWKTYTIDNTLIPSNNILCVTTDNLGAKWFGTDQGLVNFDGETWRTYSNNIYQNLSDNFVNDLEFDSSEGKSLIWIGTEKGISLLNITDPESPFFSAPFNVNNSGLIDNEVKSIIVDPGHVKWFGTFNGVSNYYSGMWESYTTKNYWIDHDKVVSLETGPDSMVYIGTVGGGVSRLKLDGIDGITSASALNTVYTGIDEPGVGKLTSDNVYSIFIEENGQQWFGTDDGIALHTSYNTRRDWKNYRIEDGLINNFVQTICKDSNDILWIGTPEGVSRFDGTTWINYTSNDGLAHNNVRDIAIDHDGLIWFATENGISVLAIQTTSISENNTLYNSDFSMVSNYPNPFNIETSILFSMEKQTKIELDIYDSNGQHVKSLVKKKLNKGDHSSNWDGTNSVGGMVTSGVYFVRLIVGSKIKTHKIMVMK